MAQKKGEIYLLLISHENQCTTLGVTSNLDLFQDEFQFDSKKEDQYLPLRSSRKDFNLELAFLRMLEQHKKKQQAYEHFLRGHDQTAETENNSETEEDIEEVLQIVSQDSDSDTLSD